MFVVLFDWCGQGEECVATISSIKLGPALAYSLTVNALKWLLLRKLVDSENTFITHLLQSNLTRCWDQAVK